MAALQRYQESLGYFQYIVVVKEYLHSILIAPSKDLYAHFITKIVSLAQVLFSLQSLDENLLSQ